MLVTGMTGAGRGTAAKVLEKLGYYVIDNIPPDVLGEAVHTIAGTDDIDGSPWWSTRVRGASSPVSAMPSNELRRRASPRARCSSRRPTRCSCGVRKQRAVPTR